MQLNKPTTAIFLIGSGIYMLDFYNFGLLKQNSAFRLVAIVNEEIMDMFPTKQRIYFDKIYVVSKNNRQLSLCHLNHSEVEKAIQEELRIVASSELVRLFPFNEYNVILAACLREKFHIPGPQSISLKHFRDKLAMKKILFKNNIRIPRFVALDTARLKIDTSEYYAELVLQLDLPFIVKPIDAAGGLGVDIINSFDDFKLVQENLLMSVAGYEAEEFLDGRLFHCDVVIKNQEIISAFCGEYNYPLMDFKHGKNVGSIPLLDGDVLKTDLMFFTTNVLQKLEAPDGITHTEIFYMPKTKEFVFLETAARSAGSLIIPMYENSFGVNLLDVDFRVHMNQDIEITNQHQQFCFWAVFPPIAGKVKNIIMPKLKSKYKIEWFVKVNDVLSSPVSMRDRVARIFAWNQDYSELKRDLDYLSKTTLIEMM